MAAQETGAPLRVAQVGTFDVANFGDLLFPLLAQRELTARLGDVELVLYSLGAKSPADGWPLQVREIDRLGDEVAGFDLVLVGGGDIIRADAWSAPGYELPPSLLHHPTSLWAAASLLGASARVPVAWNAPGVVHSFDSAVAPLARAAARCAGYLAVRDDTSRERLIEVDPQLDPRVVPDTAIGVGALLPSAPTPELTGLLDDLGVARPYVVVQPSPAMAPLAGPVRALCEQLRADGVSTLALPISPVLGDGPAPLEALGLPAPSSWPDPPLLAEVLAAADGFVGVSLHASIVTAVTGGVALRPAQAGISKYEILDAFPSVSALGDDAVAAARRLRGGADRSAAAVTRRFERGLEAHWDAVAGLAGRQPDIDSGAILARLAVEAAEPMARPAQIPRRLAELERVVSERDRLAAALEAERTLRAAAETELHAARAELSRRSARAALAAADLLRGKRGGSGSARRG